MKDISVKNRFAIINDFKMVQKLVRYLKEKKCYKSFVYNYNTKSGVIWRGEFNKPHAHDILGFIERIYKKHGFSPFGSQMIISGAFPWVTTSEGNVFWRDIALEICEEIDYDNERKHTKNNTLFERA